MDLTFLQPLYEASAPVASLYINTSLDVAEAEHKVKVRWAQAREKLRERWADEPTLRAMDEVVGATEGVPGPHGQVVYAAGGQVLLDSTVSQPPQDHVVRVGTLPDPLPALTAEGRHIPYVLAVVDSIGGDLIGEAIAQAISMAESNACMRRIVAAPTAGACGVLPAVLLPLCKYEELSQHQLLEALYVASGIGAVIAYRACIAGASGGCQAEIGTASAMAAGALVALRGGSGAQIGHAVAMALKNLMGLVCDPVAGLVEIPCVKRNVIGAVNAVSVADMAMAGIESRIPVDEVIDAMGEVGRRMPVEFRETALGGLAATPTGRAIKKRMHKPQ